MKKLILLIILFCFCFEISFSQNTSGSKPRILIFTKTKGYHHESIPSGVSAITKLGNENNFSVESTANARYFREDTLKNYAAVIFLSTTGDVLNGDQQVAFERFIQGEAVLQAFTLQLIPSMIGPGIINWSARILQTIQNCKKRPLM